MVQSYREHLSLQTTSAFDAATTVQILAYKLLNQKSKVKFFYFSFSFLVFKKEVIENKMINCYTNLCWAQKSEPERPTSSDSIISKSLCREPDPRPIQKFANGGPMDAAATQVSHWGEREGGGKEVWRCRGVIWGTGLKIHPPLVWEGPTWAGEWRAAWSGSLILP